VYTVIDYLMLDKFRTIFLFLQNAAVEWLALRTREIPGSNHGLSRLRFLMIFFIPSMRVPGQSENWGMDDSFHILSNSQSLIFRCYTDRDLSYCKRRHISHKKHKHKFLLVSSSLPRHSRGFLCNPYAMRNPVVETLLASRTKKRNKKTYGYRRHRCRML
jgi:hypothetical protein